MDGPALARVWPGIQGEGGREGGRDGFDLARRGCSSPVRPCYYLLKAAGPLQPGLTGGEVSEIIKFLQVLWKQAGEGKGCDAGFFCRLSRERAAALFVGSTSWDLDWEIRSDAEQGFSNAGSAGGKDGTSDSMPRTSNIPVPPKKELVDYGGTRAL